MPALRRTVLLSLLALAVLPSATIAGATTRIEGVSFEQHLVLGGQTLQLNGVGLRAVAWLKGYAAGLYLSQPATTAERVLAITGPKRLQMHMLLDVPVAEFVKAFHKGIGRNTPAAQQGRLSERMERFDQMIQPLGKVKKGDVVTLDYLPEQGLVFSHNGHVLGTPIPGDDFFDALLGIFIGPQPVDESLKAGLLGGRGA